MPYIKVKTEEELKAAFDLANDTEDVEVHFVVDTLVFQGKKLKLEKGAKGISLHGPVVLQGVQLWLERQSENIFVHNVAIHVGAEHLSEGDAMDALYLEKCDNAKFVNCTFSGSSDEVVSLNYNDNVIFERCFIGDPLHSPTVENNGKDFVHKEGEKGSHGYGVRSSANRNLLFTECVFANCIRRSPQCNNQRVRDNTTYLMRVTNCIIYNYGKHAFTYNNKEKDEEKGAKMYVEFYNNLFIPGPRTRKSPNDDAAIEFDCERPEKMKFRVFGIKTNAIRNYDKLCLRWGDKYFWIDAGSGPTIHAQGIIQNVGCSKNLLQVINTLTSVLNALNGPHIYDNLDEDNFRKLWPASGWKNY